MKSSANERIEKWDEKRKIRLGNLRLFTLFDIFVIAIILVIICVSLFMVLDKKTGDVAEIYLDGKLIKTLELSEDCVFELEHLTIVIKDGKIQVKDADCPDKLCEKTGAISKPTESIVCLPNKVVIKIVGKGEVEAITK